MNLNGFYLAYMSSVGYGLVLLVFKDGMIVGADAGGVSFDGTYHELPDNAGFGGTVKVSAPPNIQLVQGVDTGTEGLIYDVQLTMPSNFLEMPYFKIETKFGAVNVKLEKLRDLGRM